MADYRAGKASDLPWLVCSQKIAAPADGTHLCVKIPARALVTDIIIEKSVVFAEAGSIITVGFSGNGETADVDAFMSNAVFVPGSLGFVSIKQGAVKNSGGKYFTTAGAITVSTAKDGGTAGTFKVYVKYTQLTN